MSPSTPYPSPSDIDSLERATLDAVAPPAVEEIENWLLPLDDSTIGRAKSAVPTRHSQVNASDIARIEARYSAQGLRAAFRIADVAGLAPVCTELRQRGYRAEQATRVQIGSARSMRALCTSQVASLNATPEPAWASVYTAPGFDPIDGAHRVQALSRSNCAVYAHIAQDGVSLAAGVGTYSQGWASIHGMRTVTGHRGQGLAVRVMAALADEAIARGLDRVFLQVEDDNTAAIALYQRAGFSTAWRYHYWRQT